MLINRDEKSREGSGENFVTISNLFWRLKAGGKPYSDKSIFMSAKSPIMKLQNLMVFRKSQEEVQLLLESVQSGQCAKIS